MDIWRSLRLVRAQSLLFFLVAMFSFVAIMVAPSFAAKKTQLFRSSAKVLITPTAKPVTLAGAQTESTVKAWFTDEQTLKTILASEDLLDLVITSAGVSYSWTSLRERISMEILSNSRDQVSLLQISVLGSKAEESRILTLTLAEKFIQYIQQLSAAEHDKTVAFLERERRNAEREVARAQKRLLKIGIVPRQAGRNDPFEEAWVSLQERRSELEREDAMAQAEIEQYRSAAEQGSLVTELPDGLGTGILNDSVAKERLKLAELQEIYTDQSLQVQQQKEKLRRAEAVAQGETRRLVSSRLEAAERKRAKISALLAETMARLKQLEAARPSAEKHLEFATQERQLQMWQENYLDLTRQVYRARVMQQSSRREGAFTIVEKPLPGVLLGGKVSGMSPWMRAVLGIPMALLIGFGAVLGADYLFSSMRLQPRIEEALGLPVLGSIPDIPNEVVSEWDVMKGTVGRPIAPTGS